MAFDVDERTPCRRCGHERTFHEHLHDRDYCGRCYPDCLGYQPPRLRDRIAARWLAGRA